MTGDPFVPATVYTIWWAGLILTLVVFVPLAVVLAAPPLARGARNPVVCRRGADSGRRHRRQYRRRSAHSTTPSRWRPNPCRRRRRSSRSSMPRRQSLARRAERR